MVRQDRETANLTRALAPAMAAAFSDPSDAGLDAALSLVPEQYRESMAAQVSQLRGIRDPNRRKDVMRSALLQDEIGQALLAQLEPTANMRLQADTAAGSQALRARELSLEEKRLAAGEKMTPYQQAQIEIEREKLAAGAGKKAKTAAEIGVEQEKNAVDLAISEISKAAETGGLIDMSTGSVAGDWLDYLVEQGSGGYFVLPGDVAAAQMEVVAHLARMSVPRFQGAQSNADAALYERASGQLSDPKTSTITKKKAAETLLGLLNKRRGQFVSAMSSEETGGAGTTSGATELQYDADGNLIE
jgi:hypothetical protein